MCIKHQCSYLKIGAPLIDAQTYLLLQNKIHPLVFLSIEAIYEVWIPITYELPFSFVF